MKHTTFTTPLSVMKVSSNTERLGGPRNVLQYGGSCGFTPLTRARALLVSRIVTGQGYCRGLHNDLFMTLTVTSSPVSILSITT